MTTRPPLTLPELLSRGDPERPAVVCPDASLLTYSQLRAEIERLTDRLDFLGAAAGDRIALVLPNGPAAAIAFLTAASYGCAAPLNPRYRESEFRFYLEDLGARTLIVGQDGGSEAARAAAGDGTLVLSLSGAPGGLHLDIAGKQGTSGHGRLASSSPERHDPSPDDTRSRSSAERTERSGTSPPERHDPSPDDTALVLHTSGTTSRPKIVPIRQRNLALSATNIAASLLLTHQDRSMNVMPLFHIHGLLAGLLSPLAAGGSVACTEGFDAFRFFAQLGVLRPSFFTAVPTMHQMLLARAEPHKAEALNAELRFVRSSSASLPSPVMARLGELFNAPVIEAYGMTEATHQMCSNPLPPAPAKPKSVGLPTGIQLTILDENGRPLPTGECGEVCIKGRTVMGGYENNPEANQTAFTSGWFRTGDEGCLDKDGYLFLTGRLKEQINRGGEKVSPIEVDEVLLSHPLVAEAATFAAPHDKLGEEPAAAVVITEGAELSERQLRAFLSEQLAAFKVPRKIVFLESLPKGPTGKLQRIGLAERLGLTDQTP